MLKPSGAVFATLLFTITVTVSGQSPKPDLETLTKETQHSHQAGQAFSFAWWMPTEWWQAALSTGSMSADLQQQALSIVDDFIIVAAGEGQMGPFGNFSAMPGDELRQKATLTIGTTTLRPLADAAMSSNLRTLIQIMKPMMANSLGSFGQSMEFLVFKGRDATQVKYVDARREGSLVLRIGEGETRWSLPLVSLLPPKYDPVTGEAFAGNYMFNPFTGAKLVTVKPIKGESPARPDREIP